MMLFIIAVGATMISVFALGDAQQSYAHGYVDSPVSRVKMRKQTDLDGDLVKTAHSQKLSRHPKELKRQLNY